MKILLLILNIFMISSFTYSQWSRTNGPEGISINTLANIEGIIYAGTTVDGLYHSTDDGQSWIPLNTGIETFEVTAVAAKPGYLYSGTIGHGVYRSTNGGQTWMAPMSGGIAVSSIVVKDSFIFAGTYDNGVYRSSDNGATWTESLSGFLISILAMCVNGNTIYASSYGLTYASTDNGASWQEVTDLATSFIYSFYCDGDTIIGGAVNEIYRSTDAGSTFTRIPISFPFSVVNIYSIAELNSSLYMATSFDGVYKSNDNGSTWVPANNGMGPKDVRAIVAGNSSTLIAGTHYVGVFRSQDEGATWDKSMVGFLKGSTTAEMISNGSDIFAGTRGDGIYRTSDNGGLWTKLSAENDTIKYATVRAMTKKAGAIYAGMRLYVNATIYKTFDNGENWTRSGVGLPGNLTIIYGMATSGDNILAATDQGLYYSNDEGQNWQLTNLFYSLDVKDVAAGGNNVVYAIVPSAGIYKSTDSGINWNPSFLTFAALINLSAIDNFAYAGSFSEGSFFTTNSGNSWSSSSGFPGSTSIFSTRRVSNELVLAGTSFNPFWIYASHDDGSSFFPYSEGLAHRAPVEAFAVNDSFMFAGTDYNGVWRRMRPGAASIKTIDSVPKKYQLAQNFPNPFNPETSIRYNLPNSSKISLKIFNIRGEIIRTLVDNFQSAGLKSVTWDGRNNFGQVVSSGVYIYQLRSGGTIKTKKMMLLR